MRGAENSVFLASSSCCLLFDLTGWMKGGLNMASGGQLSCRFFRARTRKTLDSRQWTKKLREERRKEPRKKLLIIIKLERIEDEDEWSGRETSSLHCMGLFVLARKISNCSQYHHRNLWWMFLMKWIIIKLNLGELRVISSYRLMRERNRKAEKSSFDAARRKLRRPLRSLHFLVGMKSLSKWKSWWFSSHNRTRYSHHQNHMIKSSCVCTKNW